MLHQTKIDAADNFQRVHLVNAGRLVVGEEGTGGGTGGRRL